MLFLAGLLNRSSLSFILVSVVRLISIIAILFGFAMEIYFIVVNIQGVHRHSQAVSADSGSQKQDLGSKSLNATNTAFPSSEASACGYIEGTNVPITFGGVLFFVLAQLFNMIILILCLLSELSFPPLPKFFESFFPTLGQTFGVGVLGSLEVYIACNLLSQHLNTTSRACFWMLFVIGLINIFLGVIFGRRIRSKRSLLDAGTAYAKKTVHIDDIETGFSFAQKGAKKGKKAFKHLDASMISRPQPANENHIPTTESKGMHHPLDISRPILDYIQHRKEASASTSAAADHHPEHPITLPAQPNPTYSSLKTIISKHSKKSKDPFYV
ncbi:hypothetical protein PCASD_00785 [Puccinia coronata f. sp. avenae]|uniref:Uncharacterized protein n=1 Tax=Puccinia coronata f. sp. avenae TaxID=200324 RepID=A0A2N5VPR1_9BASI|nr:hypothetical protein PCASD_00785 [Puccinia coronata f. sp. avenae]